MIATRQPALIAWLQQAIARRLFRAMLQRGLAMGGFIGAEILDRFLQRRIALSPSASICAA